MSLFSESTYATMYSTAAEVPDYIISANIKASRNIIVNPDQFPKADWDAVERDSAFLEFEAIARGIA